MPQFLRNIVGNNMMTGSAVLSTIGMQLVWQPTLSVMQVMFKCTDLKTVKKFCMLRKVNNWVDDWVVILFLYFEGSMDCI